MVSALSEVTPHSSCLHWKLPVVPRFLSCELFEFIEEISFKLFFWSFIASSDFDKASEWSVHFGGPQKGATFSWTTYAYFRTSDDFLA